MSSPRTLRRWLTAALSAALVASAAVGTARAEPADTTTASASADGAAAAAVTFSDTFDGPGGAAVNSSKWQVEAGDNVNSHERQYYA
ncbi:1,3-beta-glucanase, partial [Streptomyces beijiangensis]|nr:1,3-beta-glucanase [Streptomyces beijiangensis]